MVIDDLVAAVFVHMVAVMVAAGLFFAGQQMGDINFVLNDHRLVQVPDDRLGGRVIEPAAVVGVDFLDQIEVLARRVRAGPAELEEVVQPPDEVARGLFAEADGVLAAADRVPRIRAPNGRPRDGCV